MTKEKTVELLELKAEKTKLEGDRAVLGERLQALKAEGDKTQQQIVMIAGALQVLNDIILKADPEVVETDSENI
jgi:hypothetical protein